MNSNIPMRIIQTGKSLNLPLLSKAAVANVRLLNPDFEYLFFDNKQVEEFISHQFPEYETVFHSFRVPIQRYDFFRYLAIYHYGGFYFDLDVFLATSLTDLLNYECVFPFEELTIYKYLLRQHGMDWEIGNYAFGAAAGHPFIKEIIMNCIKAQQVPEYAESMLRSIPRLYRKDFYVFCTTGPGLVSRTLAEYHDAANRVKVLLPKNVFDTTKWHCFGEYGVHLMEGTWLKRKSIFERKLAAAWESWTRKKLHKESMTLGESRSLKFRSRT